MPPTSLASKRFLKAPMLFFSSRAASLFLVLPRSMSFRAWLKREAAPSTVFRKMLPVNPSVTSTSAAPWLMASRPLDVAHKADAPGLVGLGEQSVGGLLELHALAWLGADVQQAHPGFSMPRNRRA